MNQKKARAIRKALPKGGPKHAYRAAKRAYSALPRTKRHGI